VTDCAPRPPPEPLALGAAALLAGAAALVAGLAALELELELHPAAARAATAMAAIPA